MIYPSPQRVFFAHLWCGRRIVSKARLWRNGPSYGSLDGEVAWGWNFWKLSKNDISTGAKSREWGWLNPTTLISCMYIYIYIYVIHVCQGSWPHGGVIPSFCSPARHFQRKNLWLPLVSWSIDSQMTWYVSWFFQHFPRLRNKKGRWISSTIFVRSESRMIMDELNISTIISAKHFVKFPQVFMANLLTLRFRRCLARCRSLLDKQKGKELGWGHHWSPEEKTGGKMVCFRQ